MRLIPAVVNNCVVRRNGDDKLLFVGSVTLPDIVKKKQSLEAFGTLGTVEVPIEGQLEPLTLSIKATNINKNISIEDGDIVDINIKAALQEIDADTGKTNCIVNFSSSVKAMIQEIKMGEMKTGSSAETEITLVCTYYRVTIDGKDIYEIDKLNGKYLVNGKDLLADVNRALS